MITYGFFNSVNGDRTYNADSFNDFFEGLISSNGIFENVLDAFKVTPGAGMAVNVGAGKAMVNNCWVKNDAKEAVEIVAANPYLSRYDAITLRYDATKRTVTLEYILGSAMSEPVKPTPERATSVYEIVLAYILVKANATTITAANIEDCRYNTNLCGVITGLIEQVDTTALYNQYNAKFKALESDLKDWQTAQQTAFENWYSALTTNLNVNTYIDRKVATVTTAQDGTNYIDLPAALEYASGDILEVFVGGVLFVEGLDYEMRTNEITNTPMIYIYFDLKKDQPVTFYNYKSKIGYNTATIVEETTV